MKLKLVPETDLVEPLRILRCRLSTTDAEKPVWCSTKHSHKCPWCHVQPLRILKGTRELPARFKKTPPPPTADNNNDVDEISLEEAIELIEAKRSKEEKTIKGDGGSPRPLSGFFRFCKECREAQAHSQGLLDRGDASATSGRSTLTVKELSERWKALPDEGRARHNAAAAAAIGEWKTQTDGRGKKSLEADLSTLS